MFVHISNSTAMAALPSAGTPCYMVLIAREQQLIYSHKTKENGAGRALKNTEGVRA